MPVPKFLSKLSFVGFSQFEFSDLCPFMLYLSYTLYYKETVSVQCLHSNEIQLHLKKK